MVNQPSRIIRTFLIGLDQAMLTLALCAAYFIRANVLRSAFRDDLQPLSTYLVWLIPIVAPVWLVLLFLFDGYQAPHRQNLATMAWMTLKTVVIGTVLLVTVGFLLKLQFVSRVFLLLFGVITWLFLMANRVSVLWYVRRADTNGVYRKRLVIIGTGTRARRLLEILESSSDWGVSVIGLLDRDKRRVGTLIGGHKVIGTIGDIATVLSEYSVDEVAVAVPRRWIGEELEEALRRCEAEGVTASLMADLFDVTVDRTRLREIDGIPFLEFLTIPHNDWQVVVKRAVDMVISSGALAVLWPVFVVIAMAIKATSPGPVFFVQERVGYRKRRFKMLKFRTMVQGAEQVLPDLLHRSDTDGPFFKLRDDPRVTPVGRFLRRTSFDELPQLINVLKGDMSIVGPRPVPLVEESRFDKSTQRKRFSVKPGLTCLWQISGRSALTASRRVELDLEYISRWSLGLDLRIIARTIPVVLRGAGAF